MLDKFLSLVECISEHFQQPVSTISVDFSCYVQILNDFAAYLQDL